MMRIASTWAICGCTLDGRQCNPSLCPMPMPYAASRLSLSDVKKITRASSAGHRIRIRIPYWLLCFEGSSVFRIPYPYPYSVSVSVFRIGCSVLRAVPYSVFRIRIRIPYPYPYSVLDALF
jgi:hypothetical protein